MVTKQQVRLASSASRGHVPYAKKIDSSTISEVPEVSGLGLECEYTKPRGSCCCRPARTTSDSKQRLGIRTSRALCRLCLTDSRSVKKNKSPRQKMHNTNFYNAIKDNLFDNLKVESKRYLQITNISIML